MLLIRVLMKNKHASNRISRNTELKIVSSSMYHPSSSTCYQQVSCLKQINMKTDSYNCVNLSRETWTSRRLTALNKLCSGLYSFSQEVSGTKHPFQAHATANTYNSISTIISIQLSAIPLVSVYRCFLCINRFPTGRSLYLVIPKFLETSDEKPVLDQLKIQRNRDSSNIKFE
jgi:hypothetical protein